MRTWVDSLERLLSQHWDIEVITAHTKPSWVRHAVVTRQADILLTYVAPPVGDLQSMLADLLDNDARLGVVAISESQDPNLISAAVRGGVRGWITPTTTVEKMVRVVYGVSRGETWFPPALITPVLDSLLDEHESRQQGETVLSILSVRELEILACLGQGISRQQIAEQLSLSPHTVRTHINNLLHKLDVHSVLAAVSLARQSGLLGQHSGT